MRRIKNVNEITKTDLMTIRDCLVKFDKYLQEVARRPTDENVALYEHWIDCMGDIEDIIITEKMSEIENIKDEVDCFYDYHTPFPGR